MRMGEMTVESAFGEGSTRPVTLVAAKDAGPSACEAGLTSPLVPRVTRHRKLLRVLSIEDDPFNALLLEYMMRHLGVVHLHHAASPLQGIQMASKLPLDLILLDMDLPDGHALDALAALRMGSGGAAVPIVALSGDTRPESIRAARIAGCDDYVTKPVAFARLSTLLDHYRDGNARKRP
ncbi:MAG: response regulator [Burkholderiales bacterium]